MPRGHRRNNGQSEYRRNMPEVQYSTNLRKSEKEFIASLFVAQSGKCAICKVEFGFDFHVDHDHATGRVRGLLCRDCNLGLGHFHDNLTAMRQACRYLHESLQRDKVSLDGEVVTPSESPGSARGFPSPNSASSQIASLPPRGCK